MNKLLVTGLISGALLLTAFSGSGLAAKDRTGHSHSTSQGYSICVKNEHGKNCLTEGISGGKSEGTGYTTIITQSEERKGQSFSQGQSISLGKGLSGGVSVGHSVSTSYSKGETAGASVGTSHSKGASISIGVGSVSAGVSEGTSISETIGK